MAFASPASPPSPIVLIVEDEPLLRIVASDVLSDAGFDVLEAADADEAIELLQLHPDVAIVFTDIDMPGSMDGVRLAAAICDRWPPIRIVVTSGKYSASDLSLPFGASFVPKPYNLPALAASFRAPA